MRKTIVRKLTRKSSEEFNSREACEAYIASQKPKGWVLVPDRYDDGGISGATLERPALQRLLADIEAHRVDVVVVYKIDRLSRALIDFANLVFCLIHLYPAASLARTFFARLRLGVMDLAVAAQTKGFGLVLR